MENNMITSTSVSAFPAPFGCAHSSRPRSLQSVMPANLMTIDVETGGLLTAWLNGTGVNAGYATDIRTSAVAKQDRPPRGVPR